MPVTLWSCLLVSAAAAGRGGAPPSLRDWPNVLEVQNTWLFDEGSNFGYAARAPGAASASITGPAPDWGLGSRGIPVIEVDVAVVAVPPQPPAGGGRAAVTGSAFAAVECKSGLCPS